MPAKAKPKARSASRTPKRKTTPTSTKARRAPLNKPSKATRAAPAIDVHEDDLDEAQMVAWVKQAAALPGWVP